MSNKSYPIKENSNVMKVQGGEQKVMKKILTVALSTAMAFSMFASVAFGDSATAVTPQEKFDALAAKGIFNGYPDKQAHLEKDMTRAEFAKVITKLLGLKEVTGTLSYKDKGYDAKNWAVPYIEAVTAAGIMEGQDTVKKIFNYNGKVTVQEMATVLTRALKLEVPATADNSASAWAKGYVQAAIDKGLIAKDLNFQANASRSQLVEAAYAIDQMQNVTVASYKVVDSSNVEFTLNTGEVVKVKLEKALEANKETEVKFKNAAGQEITAKVTWVVTTATKVESVTATNLKEVVVTFDGTVDENSAEQVALYSLVRDITGANANEIEKANVSADKKSVVLTVKNSLSNNTAYKLSVTGVKTGGTVVTNKDIKFTTSDVVAPTVDKVEALGNSAVKVTFSEPVNVNDKSAASNYFELDGKVVSGTLNVTGNTVIVKSFTKLADGEHKLITKKSIQDYAGYPVVEKSFDFSVVEDKTAPTIAEVKNVTFEGATVVFSEDVDPSTVSGSNVYWLDGSQKRYADSGYDKQIDGKTFKFTFSGLKKLPAYATDLFVTGAKDYSGNQIAADSKITVNAVIDQTRPEVASFTFDKNTNKSIVLKFTKAIDKDTFAPKNVVIKDSDGKVVTNIYTADWTTDKKQLKINFATALSAGTYSFELTGLKDATTLANTMLPYTDEITVGDIAQPKLVSTVRNAGSVILNFDKKMALDGEGSILNPSNYYATYTVDSNTITGQLPAGTTYETLADQKSVLIKVPSGVTVSKLTVQGVRSAAGNVLNGYVADAFASNYVVGNFEAKDAKATAKNEVVVKFNQPVASVDKTSFVFTGLNTGASVSDAWVDASNNTLVHVKLSDNALGTSTTGVQVAVNSAPNSQAITGAPINNTAAFNVKDAIKPSIVTNSDDKIVVANAAANDTTKGIVVDRATSKIYVNFTENVTAPDQAVAGQLFNITKANGDKLVYGSDYTTTVNAKTVTVTLKPAGPNVEGYNGIYRVALNNTNGYLSDSGYTDFDGTAVTNAVNNFDMAEDAVDPNAIVLDYAAATADVDAASTNDSLVLNLSESAIVAVEAGSTVGGTPAVTPATLTTKATIDGFTAATSGQKINFSVTDASGNTKNYTATFTTVWTLS